MRNFIAAIVLASLAVMTPATAQPPTRTDILLVLAVDASGSISDDRWDLERRGYADAFRDPELIRVIRSGPVGAIAVTLVQWSSEYQQSQIVGWTDGGRVISQGGGDHVVRVWEPGRATPVWEWEISPWAVLVG